jgi:hypothetical protein
MFLDSESHREPVQYRAAMTTRGSVLGLNVAFGLAQPPRPLTAAEQELVQYMRWSMAGVILCLAAVMLLSAVGPIVGGLIAFVGAGCFLIGAIKGLRFAKARRLGDGTSN